MSIFRGKQRVEKKEGFFVDLCPVCRKFTPYQLHRISLARSLWGKARGEGELRGYEGMCQECGTRVDVDPGDYRGFYEVPGSSISNLIRDTFPTIRKARAKRLEQERYLREGSLRADDRLVLLQEPFLLLEEPARRVFQRPWRWLGVAGMVLLTLCAGAGIWLVMNGRLNLSAQQLALLAPNSPAVILFAAVFLVGWGTATYVLLASRRPFHRQILPTLARALKPLSPTREELGDCLDSRRRAGAVIGKKVKLNPLWKALQ